jgi:DNA-binding transcriptional ArsR family regulator
LKKQTWPSLARLSLLCESAEQHLIDAGLYDAIADRLEQALASESSELLREAEAGLHAALLGLVKTAPADVQDAVRGASSADPNIVSAFWAGQTAFAQAFAARALARRSDDRLLSRVTDKRYERYVRALLERPQTGEELVAATGETKETVSRKLTALAQLGAIERQRQGNHVVNLLSPVVRAYLRHRNIAAWVPSPLSAKVSYVLEERTREIPQHMRHTPVLGATG